MRQLRLIPPVLRLTTSLARALAEMGACLRAPFTHERPLVYQPVRVSGRRHLR